MKNRNLSFMLGTLATLVLYWQPLTAFAKFSFGNAISPYALLIPMMSAGLIYREKGRIFSRVRYNLGAGACFIVLGLALRFYNLSHSGSAIAFDPLSLAIFSFVGFWIGVFVMCYGTSALREAAFQVSFLLLMVPLPQAFAERLIFVLRSCSAQSALAILRLFGVPVFQDGFRLLLPVVDVEVAEQCSGIRSCFALFITGLLMGHFFLRSAWRKLWLILAIFPVTVFKNGLRIVMLYELSVHPSMERITLWMHRYAGIPFSFLGLSLLTLWVVSLRKFEETSLTHQWLIATRKGFVKQSQADLSA